MLAGGVKTTSHEKNSAEGICTRRIARKAARRRGGTKDQKKTTRHLSQRDPLWFSETKGTTRGIRKEEKREQTQRAKGGGQQIVCEEGLHSAYRCRPGKQRDGLPSSKGMTRNTSDSFSGAIKKRCRRVGVRAFLYNGGSESAKKKKPDCRRGSKYFSDQRDAYLFGAKKKEGRLRAGKGAQDTTVSSKK